MKNAPSQVHKEEKRIFLKLWRLLAPFRRDFYILIFFSVLYEIGGIIVSYTVPLIVKLFTFEVQLTIWFLVVIVMMSFNEVYMRVDNRYDWHVVVRIWHPIYKFLKLEALAKFLRLRLIWHQRHNSGTLVGQVSDGIWKTMDIVGTVVWEFMPTMVQMTFSLVPTIASSPEVVLLLLLAFVIFVILTLKGEERKKTIRKDRQDAYELDWNLSVSTIQAIEMVITCGLQDFMMEKNREVQDKIVDLAHLEHYIAIYTYNRWRIRALTTIRVLIYALWVSQLFRGTMDVPNLIFLSVLMERLLSSFWRFARLADRVYGSSEAVMRLINLLDEPEEAETGSKVIKSDAPVGIKFENVCLTYDECEYSTSNGALHDLSLEIEAGKVTALVGPSGAGKSTVVAALMKLYKIQHGKITIGDYDLQELLGPELLKQIAVVPPADKVPLFDESAGYNIWVANPSASQEEVEAAAIKAGIHDFIIGLPKGYKTIIGEKGVKLSSGQRQRFAIARAVLRMLRGGVRIVILDEPTSAVDALTEGLLQASLEELFPGMTVVVIAHRLSMVRNADKIIVLKEGGMIEEGTHKELVALGGLYAKMVALQIESERL